MTVEIAEPDLMLLNRFAQTGDAGAFAQIVQRYARVVYAASIRILGDEGAAQDVSQETFFRLMQQPRLVTFSLAGWLHRTATHLALDARRSELARKHREKTFGLEQQQSRETDSGWAEISSFVDQALDELKEPLRSLLIRHFLQGVPQADLAEELDVSPATLSRRIKTGLAELQRHLKQKGIYVGMAALTGFCTEHSAHAVPTALVSELGKMQMIVSFRQLPAGPPQPQISWPKRYEFRQAHSEYIPAKFAAALIAVSLIVAAFAFGATVSWVHVNLVQQPQHISE